MQPCPSSMNAYISVHLWFIASGFIIVYCSVNLVLRSQVWALLKLYSVIRVPRMHIPKKKKSKSEEFCYSYWNTFLKLTSGFYNPVYIISILFPASVQFILQLFSVHSKVQWEWLILFIFLKDMWEQINLVLSSMLTSVLSWRLKKTSKKFLPCHSAGHFRPIDLLWPKKECWEGPLWVGQDEQKGLGQVLKAFYSSLCEP